MSVKRACVAALVAFVAAPAASEITLSQLIVDLNASGRAKDIEIFNDGDERAYVLIEPREILRPGQQAEAAFTSPDPEKLGLLVSPRKLILEPRQRRLLRIADISPQHGSERVYRVSVKPQVGEVTAKQSGLKLLIGYDMLVISRPDDATSANLKGRRENGRLLIENAGNASVELESGRKCNAARTQCKDIGGKRIYAGASWILDGVNGENFDFKFKDAAGWKSISF